MKVLKDILYGVGIEQVVGDTSVRVKSLVFDSRKVKKGVAFVAIKGTVVDGHQYIKKAIAAGAIVIVHKDPIEEYQLGITYVRVDIPKHALAVMAANYFNHPSRDLKLIGITGTNGKTTIATLLYQMLHENGVSVGLLSTVKIMIENQQFPATHTTPDPITINGYLRKMVDAGLEFCFMEVSSHGIDQCRTAALYFEAGIFTNLSHDHLDYHQDFATYRNVKKRFFDELPQTSIAITNADDKNGMFMLQNTKAKKNTYALKSIADYKAKILERHFSGTLIHLNNTELWTQLIGDFNVYNLLAVYAILSELEFDSIAIMEMLSRAKSVTGRFQQFVSEELKITTIVDYAHTPDALKNVLDTINSLRTSNEKVITVVGCGGDRDKSKRSVMGNIATTGSDKVIFTSDNPRTEDPQAIIEEMEKGVPGHFYNKTLSIVDRKQAIKTACQLADREDIVLIAGKGHETYQEINGIRNHFDDYEIARELMIVLKK